MEKEKFPRLIDSHAHINFGAFDADRDVIIDESLDQGVWMINVGSNFETSRIAVEIAERYVAGVYAAVGVHPIHVLDESYNEACMLDLIRNNQKVAAVGETGLDYFHLESERGKLKAKLLTNTGQPVSAGGRTADSLENIKGRQKKMLLNHLMLAKKTELPVIFHCRHSHDFDAHLDMLAVLEDFAATNKEFVLRGVMHCYTGNVDFARIYLKLGLYLGFTGVITFSSDYDEVVREVPLERILIETDSPYLSPAPRRGERNVPAHVAYVADKIAELKGITPEEVREATSRNALDLFLLHKH